MAAYKIFLDRDVEKDLSKLPGKIVKNILKKVFALEHQPRPVQVLKLSGTDGVYRLRVGDYRVLYTIDERFKTVTVYHIRHRREVYRAL